MATHFTAPYTRYYEIMNSARGKEHAIETLIENITNLVDSNKKVIIQMEGASWNELGKKELLESVMPKLSNCIDIFRKNVQNNLNGAVKVAFGKLLPSLENLKAKAEEWDSIAALINSNSNSGEDNSSNRARLLAVGQEITALKAQIDGQIQTIINYSLLEDFPSENIVSQISKLDLTSGGDTISKNYDFEIEDSAINNSSDTYADSYTDTFASYYNGPSEVYRGNYGSNSENNNYTNTNTNSNFISNSSLYDTFKDNISSYLNGSNLYSEQYNGTSSYANLINKNYNSGDVTTWSTLGANFIVANTKLSMAEYAALAYNRGIRQDSNTGRYGDLCLAFSEVHCQNLYRGNTSDNAETAYNWGRSTEFQNFMTNDKNELMAVIYDQIMSGKPCVLQVNGNTEGTSRHFVTVLGFKDTVKSAADLTEDDLLVMDSWDAKVERMDQANSRFITNGTQTGNGYTGYYLRILKG